MIIEVNQMRRHRVLTQSPPRQVAHLRLQAARQMAWSEAHGLGSTWAGSCISSSGRIGSSVITHTTPLTGLPLHVNRDRIPCDPQICPLSRWDDAGGTLRYCAAMRSHEVAQMETWRADGLNSVDVRHWGRDGDVPQVIVQHQYLSRHHRSSA